MSDHHDTIGHALAEGQIEPADPALYAAPRRLTWADEMEAAARLLRQHGCVVAGTFGEPRASDILAEIALTWPVIDGEIYHARHPVAIAHRAADVIRDLRAEAAGWRGSQEVTAALLADEWQRGADAMRKACLRSIAGHAAVSEELHKTAKDKEMEALSSGAMWACTETSLTIRALPIPERKP